MAPEPVALPVPDGMLALLHGSARSFSPRSSDELAHTLLDHPEAVIVAGGTDVGLWVTKQHKTLPVTVSLDAVADLRAVEVVDGMIRIGAGASYQDALPLLETHFPDFGAMIRRIGSRQIRNRGTIGGNIANASPIGDTPPALLALDASVVLRRGDVRRTMALDSFFTGYRRTVLAAGEFIERIDVPVAPEGAVFRCYKVSKRFDQDISAVCAAFRLALEDGVVRDIRIGFGGMAATPVRARAVEEVLIGRPWTEATVRMAQGVMNSALSPLSDMRASAAYRRHVGVVSAARDDDVVVALGNRVGRIEAEPAERRTAPYADPGVRGVCPREPGLSSRRDGSDVAADVERGQAEPAQRRDHHVREILADPAPPLERLGRRRVDFRRLGVVDEIPVDSGVELGARLIDRAAGRKALPRVFRGGVEQGREAARIDRVCRRIRAERAGLGGELGHTLPRRRQRCQRRRRTLDPHP